MKDKNSVTMLLLLLGGGGLALWWYLPNYGLMGL